MNNILTKKGRLPGIVQVTAGRLRMDMHVEIGYRYCLDGRARVGRLHGDVFRWMGEWIKTALEDKHRKPDISQLIGPLLAAMNARFGGGDGTYRFESAEFASGEVTVLSDHTVLSTEVDPALADQLNAVPPKRWLH